MARRGLLRCVLACVGLALAAQVAARDRAQVRAFRAENPCPATGLVRGACAGWHVDHVVALCAGGEDHPRNLQWLSVEDHRWKTFVDVRECRRLKAPTSPR